MVDERDTDQLASDLLAMLRDELSRPRPEAGQFSQSPLQMNESTLLDTIKDILNRSLPGTSEIERRDDDFELEGDWEALDRRQERERESLYKRHEQEREALERRHERERDAVGYRRERDKDDDKSEHKREKEEDKHRREQEKEARKREHEREKQGRGRGKGRD